MGKNNTYISTHRGHGCGRTYTKMLMWLLTEAGISGLHLFAYLFFSVLYLEHCSYWQQGGNKSLKKVEKRQTLGQSHVKPKSPETLLGSQRGSERAGLPTSSLGSRDGWVGVARSAVGGGGQRGSLQIRNRSAPGWTGSGDADPARR